MTRLSTDTPQAQWEAALAAHGEDPRRSAAFARFRDAGFPTTRDEDWRYTNVADVARTAFAAAPPAPSDAPVPGPSLDEESARLVFVDGRLVPDATIPARSDGLTVESLAAAAGRDPAILDAFPSLDCDHGFAALNGALWEDGAVIRFAAGADVTQPVHLVFLSRGGEDPVAFHPRILVVAERGSRGTVVETWAPGGAEAASTLGNGFARVHVAENARLDHLKVLAESPAARHVSVLDVGVARDARFHSCTLTLGATLGRTETRVLLAEPGATCLVDGLYVVDGRRHADHQTRVDHAVAHGTSHQLHKGILDDHATAVFGGSVLVRPDAQKTDARQANHNLLLSRDAVADSKPALEIFADDVKCAHGATVGRLDEDAVFYLRSRGLGDAEARALLVRAFAGEVPGRIPHEGLRRHAEAVLEARWRQIRGLEPQGGRES